jgi:MoxR-like ATPase
MTTQRLELALSSVIRGQKPIIRRMLACMAAGGHLLLEDVPGTGKTTLAKAFARAIRGADFKRVQFTPDLLPSDILGLSIFDPSQSTFRFQPGPIFTDILLADEINRSSPRVQSALLESMAERQATIDGKPYPLQALFFVIATQNPVEFRGTYPLPEAQMDRFMMQCSLGYISEEEEVAILNDQIEQHPVDVMQPVVTREEMLQLMADARAVHISEELRHYCVKLASATRKHPDLQLAASPRASLALMKCAQSMSLIEGRDFVIPETVQDIAVDVLAHRLSLTTDARYSGRTAANVVREILNDTPVPP